MSLRRILFLVFLIGVVGWLVRPAPPAYWSGRVAREEPKQLAANLPAPWQRGEYLFTPLARFELQAVVLSRRNYSGGRDGELCPTDFAVGWGAMSDAAVLNAIKISQDMRWFFYEWSGELPVPASEIEHSAANLHLLPANDEVRRELARVRRHEVLKVSGFLVEASHPDGWVWRSSLSRDDAGGGACEVMWVERVEHVPVPR